MMFLVIVVLAIGVVGVWRLGRPSNSARNDRRSPAASRVATDSGRADAAAVPATALKSIAAQLEEFRARLAGSNDPKANRAALAQLRQLLGGWPATVASEAVRSYLTAGRDAPTLLDVTIEPGGGLKDASSLRVFLLDYLGRIDRPAAGAIAREILAGYTTPDEWAVSLRNYAWANPGPEAAKFLEEKARLLLANPAWLHDPSSGFLEAFDTVVYAHGTALAPELSALMRDRDNRATAHAAYLALDRLTINQPASMLQQLVTQPDLMHGREQTRANFVARADLGQADQRATVEQYLLDPRRDPAELATFAGLYPNMNYMISTNLLTPVDTPKPGAIAMRDRAALAVVEQWQRDPRFERLQPLLAKIHERLATFVAQMARNGS